MYTLWEMCFSSKESEWKKNYDISRKGSSILTLVSYLSLLWLQEMLEIIYTVVMYLYTPPQEPTPPLAIVHNWYAEDSVVQDYVNYAYSLGGIDFVKLIECENGRRDPYRKSATNDHWICQLNYTYNKNFIKSDDFQDVYKQIDYCYQKYEINPNLRYWPNRKIQWQKCTDYVSDRFTINVFNS